MGYADVQVLLRHSLFEDQIELYVVKLLIILNISR